MDDATRQDCEQTLREMDAFVITLSVLSVEALEYIAEKLKERPDGLPYGSTERDTASLLYCLLAHLAVETKARTKP